MSCFTSVWGTTYTLKDICVTLFKEKDNKKREKINENRQDFGNTCTDETSHP